MEGSPTTDLGRNMPTSDRVPFFMPRPILRIMTDADEAVDEIDRLSIDPPKTRGPYMLVPRPASSCFFAIRSCSAL